MNNFTNKIRYLMANKIEIIEQKTRYDREESKDFRGKSKIIR